MLKTWQSCALQAKYKEIDKLPERRHIRATFGTCIHDALEEYSWTGDLEAAKKRFIYTWTYPEILNATPEEFGQFQIGTLRGKGLEILENYHEKLKFDKRTVIATEHKFCVSIGEHIISGAVDLVEYRLSGTGKPVIAITDWKTTTKQPTLNDLRLDLQFSTYAYASLQPEFWFGYAPEIEKYKPIHEDIELVQKMWDTYKDLPRRCIWYHLWGSKFIDAGERDQSDFERMYRLIEEIAYAVKKEVFIPSIKPESCLFCSYKDQCKATIPILHKIQLPIGTDIDDTLL